MILQCGVYYTITISPRDEFGNIARVNGDLLYFTVTKVIIIIIIIIKIYNNNYYYYCVIYYDYISQLQERF